MIDPRSTELDAFEERLLAELSIVVGEQAAAAPPEPGGRAAARRQRWYLLPTAAAAAAAVAVAFLATSRPEPAYAVSGRNGEQVEVKVTRLEGAEALERALRERGIPADITYLPTDKACAPDRYVDVSSRGLSLSVGADLFQVTIPPDAVGPENTFVLSAAVTPFEDGVRANVDFGVAEGAVAPCVVVDAP